jgi:uncharacterized protein (TIGR00730 family)
VADILVSGSLPKEVTSGQLTGERKHRLLGDLPANYRFETDLEPHMRKADAYVFLPDADPLLAMSVLVAKRIEPDTYWNKPVVFVEDGGKRHPVAALFEDLSARGLAKEKPEEVFKIARGLHKVRDEIGPIPERRPERRKTTAPAPQTPSADIEAQLAAVNTGQPMPKDMIAVYCSASTKKPADLALAAEAGNEIAHRGWGVAYGGANVSMMGAVAEAARNLDGYVLGVATEKVWKHNRELDSSNNNFPMSELALTDDIYLRMHKMFMPKPGQPVKGVMVLPGGAGSAQETLAMLQIRKTEPAFRDVPLVLLNADGIWNGMIKAAESYGLKEGKDFHVFDKVADAMPFLDRKVAELNVRPDWPVAKQAGLDDIAGRLGGWRDDRSAPSDRHVTPPAASGPKGPENRV